jgi:hypothetical protein
MLGAGTEADPAGAFTRGRSGNFTKYFSPASQNWPDGSPVVGTRVGASAEGLVVIGVGGDADVAADGWSLVG